MQTQQFREKIYQSMRKRADAILDLVDALTDAGHVDSAVALSEETPFRRKFSSIFNFLKQHVGLSANQSTDLVSTDNWMWLCALAYWQLLLMRHEVKPSRPAWYPARTQTETKGSTPRAGSAECFWICSAVGLTGPKHQKRWKRKRSHQRLPPSRQNTLSGGEKGEKPAKSGCFHRLETGFGNFFCF
jgi:hypothetical protein